MKGSMSVKKIPSLDSIGHSYKGKPASPAMLEMLAAMRAHNKSEGKSKSEISGRNVVYGGDMEDVF